MDTRFEKIISLNSDNITIKEAAAVLKNGGLVAFPTETVYGLGADAFNGDAAEKIYIAKGRPSDNPLIVHIADKTLLNLLVKEINTDAMKLIDKFWPGPLTLIFEKRDEVPYSTTGGLDTVAVRMPDNAIALALLRESGLCIAAPSANTSGKPSPTTGEHVIEDLDGRIDMVIDGGKVGLGLESTIIDMTSLPPKILRPGYITKEMVEQVIGYVEAGKPMEAGRREDEKPMAPGMKYRHYAPNAQLIIIEGSLDLVVKKVNALAREKEEKGEKVGIIATEESGCLYKHGKVISVGSRKKEETIAKNLYSVLREFNQTDVDVIYCESFFGNSLGQAIMNRLLKASSNHHVRLDNTNGCRGVGMLNYNRIIFVSTDNTCLSPLAAAIMERELKEEDIIVESRGIVVLFPEPVNQKAIAVARSKGLYIENHKSRPLMAEDFGEDVLILVMSKQNKQKIYEEFKDALNVYTLREFVGELGDVKTPYGGDLIDYGESYKSLERLVIRVKDKILGVDEE